MFAERGYEGTSVDDLVRALGVHRGSLYKVFGSKRASIWPRSAAISIRRCCHWRVPSRPPATCRTP
ncbi:helix-turn-helix domain-containing protein [Streptomyces herbicida]|uniref:helix-turn-helix domain-containing protein n=1 Tax=Streptomyces herbicida TaxID=3065675 RepID=UPI0038CD4F67